MFSLHYIYRYSYMVDISRMPTPRKTRVLKRVWYMLTYGCLIPEVGSGIRLNFLLWMGFGSLIIFFSSNKCVSLFVFFNIIINRRKLWNTPEPFCIFPKCMQVFVNSPRCPKMPPVNPLFIPPFILIIFANSAIMSSIHPHFWLSGAQIGHLGK